MGRLTWRLWSGERLLVLFVHPTCPPCKELFRSLNGEPDRKLKNKARAWCS